MASARPNSSRTAATAPHRILDFLESSAPGAIVRGGGANHSRTV